MYSVKIPLESIKVIVNRHDPAGLIAIGAPEDEYGLEIRSIYETLSQNELTDLLIPGELAKIIRKIFAQSFSEQTARSFASSYSKVANDLIEIISHKNTDADSE